MGQQLGFGWYGDTTDYQESALTEQKKSRARPGHRDGLGLESVAIYVSMDANANNKHTRKLFQTINTNTKSQAHTYEFFKSTAFNWKNVYQKKIKKFPLGKFRVLADPRISKLKKKHAQTTSKRCLMFLTLK